MEFFKIKTQIDFMGKRKPAIALSVLLMLGSIVMLATKGLNLGIDFTGGTLIEVGYPQAVELGKVRDALAQDFGDAQVQHFGSARDVMVRIAPRPDESSAQLSSRVMQALSAATQGVEMRRVEFVGPQIGEELTEQGGLAMLYAMFGIVIYVALRFQYRFSLGAVAALVHDVLITLGIFSFFAIPFDLTVLAAILAIIGYSLNDTIVVFDRIRELFRRVRKGSPEEIMNLALNETLSRTIMTGVTTLLVLVAMFYFGGQVLHSFALALIIGILIGTYSSVYIASALALALGVSKSDLAVVQKEGADVDPRP